MPLTAIPTYATGDTIEASWANTLRDNALILDARTGGDPSTAGKILTSGGSEDGDWLAPGTNGQVLLIASSVPQWGEVAAAGIAADSVSDSELTAGAAVANIGYTPANKAGDTFTGAVAVAANLSVTSTGRFQLFSNDPTVYFVDLAHWFAWSAALGRFILSHGDLYHGSNKFYNAGDFDIDDYALLSGATFIGNVATTGAGAFIAGAAGGDSTYYFGSTSNWIAHNGSKFITSDADFEVGGNQVVHAGNVLSQVPWKAPIVNVASGTLGLTTSLTAVTGISISLDRVGTWLLIGTIQFNWAPGSSDAGALGEADITVDGSTIALAPAQRFDAGTIDVSSATFFGAATIAAQPKTALLRARKTAGGGAATATARSQLVAIWLSP